ncbi:vacuolar protein sorting-associated protein 37A [Ceratitis capitata]|uniref:Vacuolar protein sorting-associated protein 37A n=1 Tax=Ceratitis capitata TaxID=7213 RepID=W8C774_CERCA|nr:vacuolar protein sorting-associated protein 37A [Ceratitis capitata]XP_012156943.1 vacuolar protein sorting-associated protein 37A [Ceratitis capitata]
MLPRQQTAQPPQHMQCNNLDFRKRQIDTLKVFNDNVVEVAEQEEYCIHFESSGRTLLLTVKLSVNFPNERPKIVISPTVQHHWVNAATGEVETAPGLLNYSQHSDLGRVVQAIIREYERFPPPFANIGSPITIPTRVTNINNATATPTSYAAKSLDSSNENSPLDSSKSSKMNESSLPNLSTLSLDELKQLDSDPQFFDDFIEEMSVVQHLNEELDSMISQVEIISRENESKETHLVELKRKLSDDVTALKNLGEKCDQLNKKYLKKSEEYAPQHIRELLQIAASNADSECERHVEQFLNGKIDVQTFLNNYTHSKKISAERKAKEERLGHQLTALERAGV